MIEVMWKDKKISELTEKEAKDALVTMIILYNNYQNEVINRRYKKDDCQ